MNYFPESFVIVDLETTGGDPYTGRLMEIAILKIDNMQLTDQFSALVNPQTPIPTFISKLTGINNSDVKSAPTFDIYANQILKMTQNTLFVAHNARFDYQFLKAAFTRLNLGFQSNILCTVELLQLLFPDWGKYNLDETINRLELNCPNRHRALDDCLAVWQLIQYLNKNYDKTKLTQAITQTILSPNPISKIDKKYLSYIPNKPGLYKFFDENNSLIFTNTTPNLNNSILGHFEQDFPNKTDTWLREKASSLEFNDDLGWLESKLMETQLIRTHFPRFNWQTKLLYNQVIAFKKLDETKTYTIILEHLINVPNKEISNIIDIYKSTKQAISSLTELTQIHHLCTKKINTHLDIDDPCLGICTQEESSAQYNSRISQSFSSFQITQWPYQCAIAINEKNLPYSLIIYNWNYLGRSYEVDLNIESRQLQFNYQEYRIIKDYISNPSHQRTIKLLE